MDGPAEFRRPFHDAQSLLRRPDIPVHMTLDTQDIDIHVFFPQLPEKIKIFLAVDVPIPIEELGVRLPGPHKAGTEFHHLNGAFAPNPAGNEMCIRDRYDLIHREWHTDADLSTGSDGRCRTRLFFGNYDITVKTEGCEKTVNRDILRPSFYEGGGEPRRLSVNL